MIYEKLKADMVSALKSGDKEKRLTLADIIATIDKATTAGKVRIEVTDKLCSETLIKYRKTVQEMVDTCPATPQYAELLEKYKNKLCVVNEYAPKTLDNTEEIERVLRGAWSPDIIFDRTKKGNFIKYFMTIAKSEHCDMKIANQVINKMWESYLNGE